MSNFNNDFARRYKAKNAKTRALETKKGKVEAKHIFSGLREDKMAREKHWKEAKRPGISNN